MRQVSLFNSGEYVIYPAHGVGIVKDIEKQTVSGFDIELLVIDFDHERMTVRIPVAKAKTAGLRSLSTQKEMRDAIRVLNQKGRVKRTMWPRRAQEYEAKINTGSPTMLAEVLRDLYRHDDQNEQSYSERQMYLSALTRLAKEYALVENVESELAVKTLENRLQKKIV
ncbi:MAG: CarD family transcriptional regulator [Alphaproteobacteria bacterium]|nr:MAG: CarD family transcriptional regulator [Alphaproteobacteria bacterium]